MLRSAKKCDKSEAAAKVRNYVYIYTHHGSLHMINVPGLWKKNDCSGDDFDDFNQFEILITIR